MWKKHIVCFIQSCVCTCYINVEQTAAAVCRYPQIYSSCAGGVVYTVVEKLELGQRSRPRLELPVTRLQIPTQIFYSTAELSPRCKSWNVLVVSDGLYATPHNNTFMTVEISLCTVFVLMLVGTEHREKMTVCNDMRAALVVFFVMRTWAAELHDSSTNPERSKQTLNSTMSHWGTADTDWNNQCLMKHCAQRLTWLHLLK